MLSKQKSVKDSRRFRELSEKELNEITSAVGDRARAQTVEQKERMKTSLRKAIESARTTFTSNDKKRT